VGRAGFHLFRTQEGDGERVAFEQVWASEDQTTALNYLEDPLLGLTWLSFRGADLDVFIRRIATQIELIDGADALVLAAAATEPSEKIVAIARLAAVFPVYDADAFRLFAAYATESADPHVRESAVNCMAYRGWSAFVPLLKWVIEHDSAPAVRQRAAEILPFVDDALQVPS